MRHKKSIIHMHYRLQRRSSLYASKLHIYKQSLCNPLHYELEQHINGVVVTVSYVMRQEKLVYSSCGAYFR